MASPCGKLDIKRNGLLFQQSVLFLTMIIFIPEYLHLTGHNAQKNSKAGKKPVRVPEIKSLCNISNQRRANQKTQE